MDDKEYKERAKNMKEQDIITQDIILGILRSISEDWSGNVVGVDKEKIKIHAGDTFAIQDKTVNLDTFLSSLNKEQLQVFIYLFIEETRRFFCLIDYEELKKIKL